MRARVTPIEVGRRYKFRTMSGVNATKLQMVIASFENLNQAKYPHLSPIDCDVAEITVNFLRIVRDRLALWANGRHASLSELSAVESDLMRCKEHLEKWGQLARS